MIVISLFFDHVPAALANHRRYARMHGYRHIELELSDLSGCRNDMRWAYKYEALLLHLSRAEPDACVLLLTENAMILRPAPLDVLLQGRDWLLACSESALPQTDIQLWRNTADVRAKLAKVVAHCRMDAELPDEEASLLCEFDYFSVQQRIGELMVVVPVAAFMESVWATWPTFGISLKEELHHRRFRSALFAHINDCIARGLPLLSFHSPEHTDNTPYSVFNAGRPLAVVMLYTPNITCFGRIAEANFRRYCARHGYTLHVYREIPSHLNDGKTSGNWLKPQLLRAHLPHHEWVFWIDSDVLFNDMNRRLESIIEGRDAVFARDIGSWAFNSGIMGFRRTQQNYDAFHHILNACAELDDKSSIYVNQGDQYYFTREFGNHADFDAGRVSSFIEWNTPWIYRRPDSFMVHYIGMWHSHKALQMDYDLGQAATESAPL